MTSPLPLKNKLAGNPTQEPQYSVSVKTKTGESVKLADPKATRALISLMDMNAVIGGAASHYGGPAAFAELMSAVHGIVFNEAKSKNAAWYEMFHVVNDAGHCENGLYALKANYGFAGLTFEKLKKFRSIESPLTGHGESHLFPEGVFISNGPLGSAFPQSQGLAMADACAKKERVTITAISDGACMEGEAREALAAIPGLAKAGHMAPYVLVISDNNTKLSGRIDKESFSMAPSFAALESLGWKVLAVDDGHDLQKCFDVVNEAIHLARTNPKMPVAIHAKTIKGIGTQKTAESSSGGHGFPLKSAKELSAFVKEIYSGDNVPDFVEPWIKELIVLEEKMAAAAVKPTVPEEKIQVGVSAAMVQCRKQGLPVVSVTSDLPGSTGTAAFRKEFPQDSFDVGVAEANMVSVAAGFSKCGYIPVVDTFAQFGVTKGSLPLTMASLSEAPMICIFSHTGFQDAADGASHQSLGYLAMLTSIPGVDLYCLTCSEEANSLVTQAITKFAEDRKNGKVPRSSVFFLGRENFPKTFKTGLQYQLGRAQKVYESAGKFSKWITLLPSGSMMVQAMAALPRLESRGTGVIVINPSLHNQPDLETILPAVEKCKGRFLTIEDHQISGGWGQALTSAIFTKLHQKSAATLAVHMEFGQSAYVADQLYKKHGLDAESIVRRAMELEAAP